MKNKKQSLKERLLQEYAGQLDELLEKLDPASELSLTEIEDAALALRQRTGANVTQALAETQEKQPQPDEICRHCEQKMRYKGKKPKQISTRSGEVVVKRPYYYCEHCQKGVFPPR
jgi:hypothetical protein